MVYDFNPGEISILNLCPLRKSVVCVRCSKKNLQFSILNGVTLFIFVRKGVQPFRGTIITGFLPFPPNRIYPFQSYQDPGTEQCENDAQSCILVGKDSHVITNNDLNGVQNATVAPTMITIQNVKTMCFLTLNCTRGLCRDWCLLRAYEFQAKLWELYEIGTWISFGRPLTVWKFQSWRVFHKNATSANSGRARPYGVWPFNPKGKFQSWRVSILPSSLVEGD